MAARRVRLSAVLQPAVDVHEVNENGMYPQIGMLNFARGTFKKPDLAGYDTKYKTLHSVSAGQVIYSKLKAFEGALGIVPSEHDGHFVSQEFPTFDVNHQEADPDYLLQVFQTDGFADQLAQSSKGVGARRERLHPTAFLNIEIPLPHIDEQRRIVERVHAAEIPQRKSIAASEILASGAQNFLTDSYKELPKVTPLSRVLSQRGDWISVEPERAYATIGLSKSGRGAFVKTPQQVGAARLMALRRGDFVYSRLFAWQGSMALVPETNRPLYASNEFPSFEIDQEQILPEFLLGWFRQPDVWTEIERQCTGSTSGSRNRFKESNLLAMLVPVPAMSVQSKIVSGLQAFGEGGALNLRRFELAKALPKSVRNEIFSKLV